MTDDLPVPPMPVDDRERAAAIARIRDLYGEGTLSPDGLEVQLQRVLSATSQAELESAMTPLPSPVRLTPAPQRLSHPVVLNARMSTIDVGAGWQLGSETVVSASTGTVVLDLAEASWDASLVDLRLDANLSTIEVIVPVGVRVQIVSATGLVDVAALAPAFPGAPVVRVTASSRMGLIRFAHEREPPSSRSGRRRRDRRG